MSANEVNLKELLKARLFQSIAAQIDAIGYVPESLSALVGAHDFKAESGGEPPGGSAAGQNDGAGTGLLRRVNSYYDAAFYSRDGIMGLLLGDTDYRNIGYWTGGVTTQKQASERLQDALLDFIPEKSGRILDVACGMGASTRRLLDHYAPENVWAINISEKQIETTRRNAPGCNALVMNAAEMTFEDDTFDNILCIEAAFHFDTRRKFLEHALRVLKRGGRLVLSDVLFTSKERLAQYPVFPGPENHLATVADYRDLLSDVGFRDIIINDVSKDVWRAHFLHVVNRIHEGLHDGTFNIVQVTDVLWTYYQLNAITGPCLFISAQK